MDQYVVSHRWFTSLKLLVVFSLYIAVLTPPVLSLGQPRYVENTSHPGSFAIAKSGAVTSLCVDGEDYSGVVRAVGDLKEDINRVTGQTPLVIKDPKDNGSGVILIGTIGKSHMIDGLIRDKKINVSAISGKWESFLIQVVSKPLPGVSSALVIAGSDKRGTIYGIYDLSEQIGVSPWYWWADVPVSHTKMLSIVKAGKFLQGPPAVKYRGIFLNDEAPALSGWVHEKFGGFNYQFYVKVFELILRLKGQLSLAGDVGQRLQRRRSGKSQARRRIRHRHGHVSPRADAARAAGMETSRQRPMGLHQKCRCAAASFGRKASSATKTTRASSPSACAATAICRCRDSSQHRAAGKNRRRPAQDHRRAT